jgi:isochorismate pyruvate lyase
MDNLKKPVECKSKDEIRNQIDNIDYEIISLFANRFEFVKEIVKYKEKNTDAIIDLERKNFVIDQRANWAEELGLNKEIYAHIFRTLVEHNISKELEMIKINKLEEPENNY